MSIYIEEFNFILVTPMPRYIRILSPGIVYYELIQF